MHSPSHAAVAAARTDTPKVESFPNNPVLTRVLRDGQIESQHRGAWVLVDTAGNVLDGAGAWNHPVFARSSTKSLQALPLIESGAAAHYRFDDAEIALALSSHDAEACHTERVAAVLARLGLSKDNLQCGPQQPGAADARKALAVKGEKPSALHNNCSGKHAGFLALAQHLGVDVAKYLETDTACQLQIRRAVEEMTGAGPGELSVAIDGCSAPTFRVPLAKLATGLARVANPDGLAEPRRRACERMTAAAAAWPELIAGTRGRLCTDLIRASKGRLFPKVGSEAVYVIGVRGADRGIAIKVDDGASRGYQAFVIALLQRFGWLSASEADALSSWRAGPLHNWAGVEVGRVEVAL
jgi:L-asparaginase II